MSSTRTTITAPGLTLASASDPESSQVHGKLRYIPRGHVPVASPHHFHLPAIAEFSDVRRLPLSDMRPVPTVKDLPNGIAQLSTHGFTAVHHPSAMHSPPYTLSSWKDPALLKQIYVPETEEMLKQITGAKTVITEGLLLRSQLWSEQDALATHAGHGQEDNSSSTPPTPAAPAEESSSLETGFPQFIGFTQSAGGASPAPKIHLDYAPKGARVHLRQYHPTLRSSASAIIAAEDTLTAAGLSLAEHYASTPGAPRWALFSIWRPLKRVTRDPLALGDARTFTAGDYIPVDVVTPNLGRATGCDGGAAEAQGTHTAESYLASYAAGHRWWWISDQRAEEVLVIGLFDSDREKADPVAGGGTLHSSVELEGVEGEAARESLEFRCLAIW